MTNSSLQGKWTPGPWTRRRNSPHLDLCAPVTTRGENIENEVLVTVHIKGGHGYEEALANLNLIAAAPELADIVEQLATFDARNSIVHLREMARAALAKANPS
jgi:hypothetical protein